MPTSSSAKVVGKQADEQQQRQLNPNEVFERLQDMFGMMADSSVILEVGAKVDWRRKLLLQHNCSQALK